MIKMKQYRICGVNLTLGFTRTILKWGESPYANDLYFFGGALTFVAAVI